MSSILMMLLCSMVLRCKSVDIDDIGQLLNGCDRKIYNCYREDNTVCKCDGLCHYYGDCCYDALAKSESADNSPDMSSDCSSLIFQTEKRTMELYKHVFMISKCPTTWEDAFVKVKCETNNLEDLLDMFPVTSTYRHRSFTFKNRYCAECNGMDGWIQWNLIEIDCSSYLPPANKQLTFTEVVLSTLKRCAYNFIPLKHFNVRQCHSNLYAEMGILNGTGNGNVCFSGPIGIVGISFPGTRLILYRNRDCAKMALAFINNNETFSITCPVVQGRPQSKAGISAQLDLSHLHRRTIQMCKEREIYLSARDGCQVLDCPYGLVTFHGECVHVEIVDGHGITLGLLYQLNTTFDSKVISQMTDVLRPVTEITQLFRKRYFTFSSNCLYRTIAGVTNDSAKTCTFLEVTMVTDSYSALNASYRQGLNSTIKHYLENYKVVMENNVLLQHVNDIKETSCISNEFVRNPTYLIHNFGLYHNYDLPCPAVKLVQHIEPEKSTSIVKVWYSLPSNKTAIAEDDVIRSSVEYFVCIDTYMTSYKNKATAGSDCLYAGNRIAMLALSPLLVVHILR